MTTVLTGSRILSSPASASTPDRDDDHPNAVAINAAAHEPFDELVHDEMLISPRRWSWNDAQICASWPNLPPVRPS